MELINYQNYETYKKELDGELKKTAEGFVRIGYLLKVARDTNILAESGYKSVTEFAQKEYGLDKTQVSRFISINDRFAHGGEKLLPEYEEYGYAKLTIMLQIPEEITQELTPNYTKAEIQAVKEELDEERKVSDLEVMMEGQQEEETDVMWMTLKQLGHDDPNLWEKMWQQWKKTPFLGADETAAIMAPSGDKNYSVRIMGKGRVMLTMKDGEDAVTITNTRTLEKDVYTKQQMANLWCLLLHTDAETEAEAWQKMYLEPWPKAEVAPVQPEKKPEPKKESKVTKAKVPEKPKKPGTETKPKGEEKHGEPNREDVHDGGSEPVAAVMAVELHDGAGSVGEAFNYADTERRDAKEDPEGDGAPEGNGSAKDPWGNNEFFEMTKKAEENAAHLFDIMNSHYWYYDQKRVTRAYRLTLALAADMERIAQRNQFRLYEE